MEIDHSWSEFLTIFLQNNADVFISGSAHLIFMGGGGGGGGGRKMFSGLDIFVYDAILQSVYSRTFPVLDNFFSGKLGPGIFF